MIRASCMGRLPASIPRAEAHSSSAFNRPLGYPWLFAAFRRSLFQVIYDPRRRTAERARREVKRRKRAASHCSADLLARALSVVPRGGGLSISYLCLRSGPVPPPLILGSILPKASMEITAGPRSGRQPPAAMNGPRRSPSWPVETREPLPIARCYLAVMTGSHPAGAMAAADI